MLVTEHLEHTCAVNHLAHQPEASEQDLGSATAASWTASKRKVSLGRTFYIRSCNAVMIGQPS